MKAKMYDFVLLKDGRKGRVVDIYEKEKYGSAGYEVELPEDDPQGLTIGVKDSDVIKVIQ